MSDPTYDNEDAALGYRTRPTQYLILHKVRGEPAFDVAEQMENGWWIIPTSGHRAHPYKWWPLHTLCDMIDMGARPLNFIDGPLMPSDWPDHYAINDSQRDGGSDKLRSVPAARKATVTPTLDDLD